MFYLKYRFRVISILVPAVLFVSACTQPMATDSQARLTRNAVPSSLAHIPFAGDDELAAIDSRKDSSIIPWKLARRLAYFEFRGYYQSQFSWAASTLSERPVVIYDKDSKPRYYEFVIYNSSERCGGHTYSLCHQSFHELRFPHSSLRALLSSSQQKSRL